MYGQQVMCWAAKLGTQDGTFFGFIGGSVDQIDIARMDCLTKFIMASQSPFYIEVVYFRSWRCPKFRPLFQTFHQSIFHEASSRGGANRSSDSIMDRIGCPNHLPIGSHWFPLGTWWLAGPKRPTAVMGSEILLFRGPDILNITKLLCWWRKYLFSELPSSTKSNVQPFLMKWASTTSIQQPFTQCI